MARKSVGEESGARTAGTEGRAARPEAASGELERVDLGEVVQRLARGGRSGPGIGDAAFAMQRIAGNRSTARKLGGGGGRSVREVARSGFQGGSGRLPFMSRIQRSFGAHDISGVRSFVGPGAAAASRALSAEAYASGDRVVFADSSPGLHTVAHEAAHVIQQRAGIRLSGGVGEVGDRHERHADAVADKVVRGESAERSLDSYFAARPGAASSPARNHDAGVQRKFDKQLKKDLNNADAEKKTDERYALIIDNLMLALKDKKYEKLSLNDDAVLAPMLYRLEKRDDDVTYETYEHLIDALKARGALLVDGKESGVSAPDPTKKFLINLFLPGSGDRRWRTTAENMLGGSIATRKRAFSKMKEIPRDDEQTRKKLGINSGKMMYPTVYEDPGSIKSGVSYTIRGPGTSNSLSTHPSNNIDHNVATARAIVDSYIEDWGADKVKVRIMGHSRNGVTATLLTRELRREHPKLELDAVIFDPVPGDDANMLKDYEEATLPNDKEKDQDVNTTVVFSLQDDRIGFNPMKVNGARRLILTHYPHHAGIEPGFIYKGKHLKELGLLELDPGLYVDIRGASPGKPNQLIGPVEDWEQIETVFVLAQQDKKNKNENRIDRIRKVVEAFLGTKRKEWGEEDLPYLSESVLG